MIYGNFEEVAIFALKEEEKGSLKYIYVKTRMPKSFADKPSFCA
jgi:hypothetical protein